MTEDKPRFTAGDLQKLGAKWMERIKAAEKREDDWIKDAEFAENSYLCAKRMKDAAQAPEFNILHSNVETIVPSIYNSSPSPDIRPRFNASDPIGKQVADVLERAILAQIDDNKLDTEVESAAQDTFIAGRGVVRVKFDADVVPAQYGPKIDPMTGGPVLDEAGEPAMFEIVPERLTNERVEFEAVSWRDYRFGPCKRFEKRPWEAFRHCISQEELHGLTDKDIAGVYAREPGSSPTENEELDVDVWEVWCSETRRVYFIVAEQNKVLSVKDDPLAIPEFYSVRSVSTPIKAVGDTMPVCPYSVYKRLAEELDTATRRIAAIMRGIKNKALVAGAAGDDIERLAEASDNELVFAANLENLAATGGIDRAVLWWPIEASVNVLRELYAQREQTKVAIYEITGISDIIRGQGAASETATAQQIKTQWGSLRIKKMQRMVERQVRDIFVLASQIICRHFSPESLQRITGIQVTSEMAQFLQKPLDHYRIDVESDSTVRADLTNNRREMGEFLQGTAQFFSTVAPIIAQAPAAAGPIADMYAAFARQFNLGKQAEDALEQFVEMAKQAASQPRPNPEAEAAKEEVAMKQKAQEQEFTLGIIDRLLKKRGLDQDEKSLDIDAARARVDAASKLQDGELM